MNLKLIEYHDHLDGEGEFIAWTVVFTDLDRGRNMVAMIYGDALFELAMCPVGKAFDVGHLAQGKLEAVEYPSGRVPGLVKGAIRGGSNPGDRPQTK